MDERPIEQRLRQEVPRLWAEIEPDSSFLERLRRLQDREGRPLIPAGERPGRPPLWRRMGVGRKLEFVAACVALAAVAVIFAMRQLPDPEAPPVPAGQEPTDPSAQYCQKPLDSSGVVIELYKGNSDSTYRIQPGWTIPFPARWFGVLVRFPRTVQTEGIKVTVDPPSWQTSPMVSNIEIPDSYGFNVLPDGEFKAGKGGWITVTVEGARDGEGKPFGDGPIRFRLWAMEPVDPANPPAILPVCPGLEVAPPGGGL